jgi:hypothetical protein
MISNYGGSAGLGGDFDASLGGGIGGNIGGGMSAGLGVPCTT